MTEKDDFRLKVPNPDSEEPYFRKKEEELIRDIREAAQKEAQESYQAEHRNHCFRCGTSSLVEVVYCGVAIDVCLNEDCLAVHLDSGELESILEAHKKSNHRVLK